MLENKIGNDRIKRTIKIFYKIKILHQELNQKARGKVS